MLATTLSPAEIYAHLEAVVLPVLMHYQTDLTQMDRNTLANYSGPFLLSYRATGTNLLILGPVKESLIAGDPRPAEEQVTRTFDRKRAEISWDYNKYFLHYDGHKFHQLSREQALKVTDEGLAAALAELATLGRRR